MRCHSQFQEVLNGFAALSGDVVFDGASDEFAARASPHHSIDCLDGVGHQPPYFSEQTEDRPAKLVNRSPLRNTLEL